MPQSGSTTMEFPDLGTTIAGKYRLQSILGEGGMGRVYRAHHELMDKRVALKVMSPTLGDFQVSKARFLREAQAAARIRHPNVVEVYDVGVEGALLFMVMEFLEGTSFREVMLGRERSSKEKLTILLEAMRGIAAAHEQGIVHRDIKPDNIFVARSARAPLGVAKVLDFGISKLRDDVANTNVTESGIAIGTPIYMSSEQMHGARDVDARTDIYSVGVMLYETLTGRLPFDGDTPAAIAVKMHTTTPPSLRALRPELPAVLEQVVLKAMAIRREERYESMNALVAALEPALPLMRRAPLFGVPPLSNTEAALAATMPTPIASVAARAARQRRPWKLWAGLAVPATIMGALGWHFAGASMHAAQSTTPLAVPQTPAVVAPAPSEPPMGVALPVIAPEAAKPDAGASEVQHARKHLPRAARPTKKAVQTQTPVAPEPVSAPAQPRAAHGLRSGELRPDDL